ncbi:pyruvoyl-dependent arginine decarboxylase subunit alpha [Halogeometricum borinquense]|uniref:arginine decarboxylase n=1 Tax=Halogeometricum borinquense TaxID=60847 RepID=A0A6C0UL09_9EURY|nr:pyruvoyl-dependent arginine decarboxylase [Halogeometricum borinquense]QIB75870.1 pyruvoyl-dependent arginine decarboxylase subunit alpha [Halogeometricum borinquense]QIQ75547.1 pyruvoyl-dependent arginine decarboxylase subunit alpha [Halogeometricum borinquense]
MNTIYVVRGVGTAPTEMASYDAALAAANIHNYNLVAVSSVIPADTTVEEVDTAPDLGPAGNRLTVVEARATTSDAGTVAAGLGWTVGPGPGLFYEASGEDAEEVRHAIEAGLSSGRNLRDWQFDNERVTTTTADADGEGYTTAITVAAYGQSEPIF